MARRAGLTRGLADVPSGRTQASGVLRSLSAAPARPSRGATRPALRIVTPADADAVGSEAEAPPALEAVEPAPTPSPEEPVRKVKGKAKAKPKSKSKSKSKAKAKRVPGAKRAPHAVLGGSRPAAPPEASPDAELDAPPVGGRDQGWIRVFYERFARRMSELFGETMAGVVRAGLGLEEVIPESVERLGRGFARLPGRTRDQLEGLFSSVSKSELLDPDTWQGLAMLLSSSLEVKLDLMKRRRRGDYVVDEFGLDEEYLFRMQPLFRWLYRRWWRVEISGLENVPSTGRALLVANHSGVLPYDGAMIATAVWDEHPSPRLVRALHLEWFVAVPFVAPFLQKTGQVMANPENGERLLERGHLVTVFPEGLKGVGKRFKDRYQLARFGRGGFVRMAINARSSIIPVSVVGAEEIHPVIMRLDFLGKPIGLPFFPVSPTWPLLGPLGLIPVPSKWYIHFGEPLDMSGYTREDASDFHFVSQVADQVRTEIQRTIQARLEKRQSVLFG